jgi:hypothetical protein
MGDGKQGWGPIDSPVKGCENTTIERKEKSTKGGK